MTTMKLCKDCKYVELVWEPTKHPYYNKLNWDKCECHHKESIQSHPVSGKITYQRCVSSRQRQCQNGDLFKEANESENVLKSLERMDKEWKEVKKLSSDELLEKLKNMLISIPTKGEVPPSQRLCKDCKFIIPYENELHWSRCINDKAILDKPRTSYVTGETKEVLTPYAHTMRGKTSKCGPDAKWFEPKL